ncbi:MAG TPA: nitroreductase family deazaflavin-dependent oxidoreductase [Ktedonobacteraceae bacterium]|nr:nitroreductase family deazaflavin-dependent oxidoreductase [Ktedonobacteraceae bacterium]
MLPDRLRTFNKHVTNRFLRVFTGLSHGPFAIIHHVGRRSGKPYETVLWVWQMREGFVIALTYGTEVDWYRNMRAADGGAIYWHKRLYNVGKPELVSAETALTAFPTFFKFLFRTFGKQMQFVLMKPSGAMAAQA